VDSVHLLGLDIDEQLTEASLLALLEKLKGHAYALHPTHSCYATYHASGHYKVRVIIPLSEPIPFARWEKFWLKAQKYFDAWTLDTRCKNANHLYYLPAAPSQEALDWMAEGFFSDTVSAPLDVAVIEAMACLPSSQIPKAPVLNVPLPQIEAKLHKLAQKLEKKDDPSLGLAMSALLGGRAYSEFRSRHDAMIRLTHRIGREFPHCPPETLAPIFERSQAEMTAIHESPPDSMAAIIEGLGSAQAAYHAECAELALWEEQRATADNERAAGVADPDYAYTDDDREEIAEALGITADENIWIIMSPASKEIFFVTLKGLVGFLNTPENVAHHLGLLRPTGIEIHNVRGPKESPRLVPKALKDLTDKNTRSLEIVRYDNRIQQHRLDGTVLTLPCLKSSLQPTYVDEVDGFLRALFGDEYAKGEAWLSWFPDTSHLLCALFLSGPGGSGKTLLAEGLARIWEHGYPVTFDQAITQFNFDITKSPFIFADEGLPRDPAVTEHLRKLTGNRTFKIEKKYGDTGESLGARRVMIAANNSQALNFQNNMLERDDLEALQERIWVCPCSLSAKRFLAELSFEMCERMAREDIAKHVLWLAENRRPPMARGARFAVSGATGLFSAILIDDHPTQRIFTILQSVMDDDFEGKDSANTTRLKATGWGKGSLYVCGPDICTRWVQHFKEAPWTNTNVQLQKVGTVTRALFKGKRVQTCRVNTELFYQFLEQRAGVDSDPYRAMVDGDLRHVGEG
jgi:hypothetical protein